MALLLFISNSLFAQQVDSFTLVNSDTDTDILELTDGLDINQSLIQGINLNIRADTNPPTVGSVVFDLSGPVSNNMTENVAPYALFGDIAGDYLPGLIPIGNYTLTATPFASSGGNGTAGTALTIQFSVIDPPPNLPPVAVATADINTGDAPLLVNFTGSNSTDDMAVVSYAWVFGDGNSDTTADPSHTYVNPGNYSAILTVTDGGGLQDSDTLLINVQQPNQSPVAVASSDVNSGDAPLTVNFTGSGSTDDVAITSYTWDFGDGNSVNVADPAHTYVNPGNFSAILTVTDGGGLQDSDTLLINVQQPNQPPAAVASSDINSGDAPLTVNFTGSNSTDDVAITSYAWDFGDGNIGAAADTTYIYPTAGTFQAILTVMDAEGLADSDTLTIDVQDPVVNLPPVAVASSDVQSGDAPLTVNFTGSGSTDDVAITSYAWDFGDGNFGAAADTTYIYPTAGTFQAILTVMDAEGLADSDTLTIDVQDPVVNLPPVAVASSDVQNGDAPLTVNFTGSNSTDDVAITSYAWDFGDGNFGSAADTTYIYPTAGTYQAILTVMDAEGLTDSDTLSIDVQDPVVNLPPVAVATSDVNSGDAPLTVNFTGSGSSDDVAITSYAWDFGDGNIGAAADTTYIYPTAGTYQAILTVMDAEGLADSDTLSIDVQDPAVNLPPVAVASSDVQNGDAPLTVNFTGSGSSDDVAITSYAWDFGDGNFGSAADTTYIYPTAGTFQAILTVMDAEGLADSDTLSIDVQDPAVNLPPVAVASSDVNLGDAPLTVNFTGSGSTDDVGISTYSWDFGDGGTDTIPDPAYTYNSPGNYTAQLIVSDAEGLQDSTSVIIDVLDVNEVNISGNMEKWGLVALEFNGPLTSENDTINPFLDYRLNVTFTSPGGTSFEVPGFYAADGNAAETSASSGSKWAVRLMPHEIGQWIYSASFRTGQDVAISLDPNEGIGLLFDGISGNFNIIPSTSTLPDNSAKGLLEYQGEHYYQFAETSSYYLKAGTDSPENLLAYSDFDNTVPSKAWLPHVQDWNTGDPGWQNGKGKGLVGVINYLEEKGMNAFSFIVMNVIGDGKDVWPWNATDHEELNDTTSQEIANRLRYDVSKLEQWEIVFSHGDRKGMFLHFKTQETENDMLLDGGELGRERKLFYRELIARFSHHLALNWNLGEENDIYAELSDPDNTRLKAYAQYIHDLDPYDHPIVVHSLPTDQDLVFGPLLGPANQLTGPSIQSEINDIHQDIKKWVLDSENAGKKWAVANDEQGNAQVGVTADFDYPGNQGNQSDNRSAVRAKSLWGTLMAGGYGVEYYFGYDTGETDLSAEDLRSRESKWEDAKVALDFFNQYIPFWELENKDELLSNAENYCFGKTDDLYVLYLSDLTAADIDLTEADGTYTVKWFNPVSGGPLVPGSINSLIGGQTREIGIQPDSTSVDWVVLLKKVTGSPLAVSTSNVNSGTAPLSVDFDGSNSSDNGNIISYLWDFGDGGTSSEVNPSYIFNSAGQFQVTLTVTDDSGLMDTDVLTIDVSDPNQPPTATISATPLTGVAPLDVSFIGSGSSGNSPITSYNWDFGDGNTAAIADTLYTYANSGSYIASLSVTDSLGLTATDSITISVQDPVQMGVIGFTLIDSDSDTDLLNLLNGTEIFESTVQGLSLAIRAETNPNPVGSVFLSLTGPVSNTRTENVTPYALFGNVGADYSGIPFVVGDYTISATAYSNSGLGGSVLGSLTLQFSIVPASGANQPPTANASANPLNGDAPLLVNFIGSTSSDDTAVVSYSWDFGDGGTDSIADPAYTYSNPGNYIAQLIVSDAEGLQDSTTVSIDVQNPVVNQPPTANASANPLSGDAPLLVNFIGSTSTDDNAVVAYSWDFGDGGTDSIADPAYSYTIPGNYIAQLIVSDAEGLQDSTSVTIDVQDPVVNQPPTASASANPLSGDVPLLVNFTGSTSTDDNAVVAYNWDFGDGGTDSIADPIYTYNNPGNYIAQLIVSDVEGLQDSTTVSIDVQNPVVNQPPTANASANPLSGDAPLLVNFTGSTSTDDNAVVAYSWDFGDGGTDNIADPTYSYTNPGNYIAQLIVSDAEGLQDSTTVSIDVQNPVVNQPPTANASANPLSGDAPLLVNFIGSTSTDDNAVVAYSWDFGDGGTDNIADPAYSYANPGNYIAQLIVSDAEGLQDSTTVSIQVDALPQMGIASFTLVNADLDSDLFDIQDGMQFSENIIQGISLNIRANTIPGIVGSVFIELIGPINNTRTENVAPYALFGDVSGDYLGTTIGVGNYTISATAYSNGSLGGTVLGTLTETFSITAQGTTKITIPEFQDAMAIDQLTQEARAINFQILPNPASDTAVLVHTAQELSISEIAIFSLDGRNVRRYSQSDLGLDQNRKLFQVSDLEEGVYLVVVKTNSPKVFQTKLVVSKHQ